MYNHFPIVLEPEGLSRINSALPPLPKIVNKPIEPQVYNETVYGAFCIAISFVIYFIMLLTNSIDGSGAFLPVIILSTLLIYVVEKEVNRRKKKNFYKETEVFNTKLLKYEKSIIEYNEAVSFSANQSNIDAFRKKHKLSLFGKAALLKKTDYRTKKGATETEFESTLLIYFPGMVLSNKAVGFNPYEVETHYKPDFILIEPETLLHIDIEIDEPYLLKGLTPIHYLNNNDDLKRNLFFQQNGWLVIRFAEEQIVKYPAECCKFIAETIYDITGIKNYLYQFRMINPFPYIKQWTKEESLNLAKAGYRNKYLFAKSPEVGNKSFEEDLKEHGLSKGRKTFTSESEFDKYIEICKGSVN